MTEEQYYLAYGLFWSKENTDLRECSNCGDTIYSDMYLLSFNNKNGEIKNSEYALCQSCKGI